MVELRLARPLSPGVGCARPSEGETPPRPTLSPRVGVVRAPDMWAVIGCPLLIGVGRNRPIRRLEQLGRYGLKVAYEDKKGVSP